MKILDRYFLRQLWGSLVGFGVVLCGLAWMVQILLLMKLIVKYGVNVGDFMGLSLYTIPMLVSVITPFVIFIAAMFVYNKMIANSEITVCAASGQSPLRIARPAILVGALVMLVHLVANVWLVPMTQDMFYGTQWELRYGLGHLKLREAAFNQLMTDVVIYVEQVNKKDLYGITMRDGRRAGKERIVSSEIGKLVNTPNGLTIAMGHGSLQIGGGGGVLIGTFDGAETDMEMNDSPELRSSKARRMTTMELLGTMDNMENFTRSQKGKVYNEIASRFLTPLLDVLFVLIAAACLLESNVLRRRASYASLIAAVLMIAAEGLFMALSTAVMSQAGLLYLGAGQLALIACLLLYLRK